MAAAFEAAMIEQSKSGLVIESVVHVVMSLVLVILWPVGMAVVMAVMVEVALVLVMGEPEVLALVKMEQLVMPLVVLLMAGPE